MKVAPTQGGRRLFGAPWVGAGRRLALNGTIVMAVAALVSVLLLQDPLVGFGVAGGFVLLSMLGIADARTPRFLTLRGYRWMPAAWLILLVISNHQLDPNRSPLEAAAGLASTQNLAEIGAYGAIATLVAMMWNFRGKDGPVRIAWGPLVVLPIVAGVSVLWSLIPVFSLVRSVQLAVPFALAVLLARIWRTDPEIGLELWRRTCVALVLGVVALVAYGWVAYGPGAAINDGRFTWPMMHPVHAGIYCAVALIVVLVGGRSFTRLPASLLWAIAVALSASLYLTRTRSALGAFVVAYIVALLLPPRSDAARRYVGIVWLAGAGIIAWVLSGQVIVEFLARGQSTEVFTDLNSRVPLWNVAFEELAEGARWLTGFGFGSARVVLFARVSWAGTAHNAWVELLLGTGVVGCVVVAIAVFRTVFRSLALARSLSRVETRLAATIVVFLVVVSLTTSELAIPGFDYSLLVLVYAMTLALDARDRSPSVDARASG
jgi:O-antigen ligase